MKRRFAALAAATFLLELGIAQTCYADVLPGTPSLPESAALIAVAVLFVAAVSGFSFWQLRRIARQRAEAAARSVQPWLGDDTPDPAAGEEPSHED